MTCWGEDAWPLFEDSPESGYRSISLGLSSDCAVLESGQAVCRWKDADPAPGNPKGTGYVSVSAGWGGYVCGLRESGAIWCDSGGWEGYDYDGPGPPEGSYRSVAAGGYAAHMCGVLESGEVVCWGTNWYGESSPPEGKFRSVTAGRAHTCALRETGEIDCWGATRPGAQVPSGLR